MQMQDTPEFERLPSRNGRCGITGLSRSSVEELVRPSEKNNFNPPVKAKYLRKPGALRGVWLIPRQALIDYINGLPSSAGGAR